MNFNKFSLLLVVILTFGCQKQKDTISPKHQDIIVSVYGSAQIEPLQQYDIYPETSGIITQINYHEGDYVDPNNTIATIRNEITSNDVQANELKTALAKENTQVNNSKLFSLRINIKNLQHQYQLDSTNYSRQQKLWNQHIGTQLDFDRLKLQYQISKENLAAAKKLYLQTKNELQKNYAISLAQLNVSKSNFQNSLIKSQRKGKIYALYALEGEMVNPQKPFATIGDLATFIIKIQIDEIDIPKIELGQEIVLQLDAFENQIFNAYVSKIYPSKNITNQTFTIEGTFYQQPKKTYPGLAGDANIIIQTKKNALTIPVSYLSKNHTVFNTNEEEIKITTGLQNLETVEIIKGISKKTSLIKPIE